MEVIGGVDADSEALAVFRAAFPNALPLYHDLIEEQPRYILRKAGIARGDVDVLVGGPPCQPYSINNHQRSLEDSRCDLVQRYLEFVSTLRPAWLVMENVPAFISIEGGVFFKTLLRSLRSRGYKVAYGIIEATNFGVPQKRRRLIVVANRQGKDVELLMKGMLARKSRLVTVGHAIGDLPDVPERDATYLARPQGSFQKLMRRRAPRIIQSHMAAQLGPLNLNRIRYIPPGGNWRDIPRKLLPPGMQRAKLSDHTTRYGRLLFEEAAFTLLTKCDPHWGCYLHPTEDRIITVREAARLQSIPDRIQFIDSLTASYRMIGNAVPPLLAKGILGFIQ